MSRVKQAMGITDTHNAIGAVEAMNSYTLLRLQIKNKEGVKRVRIDPQRCLKHSESMTNKF
jgi:hypothetical protein